MNRTRVYGLVVSIFADVAGSPVKISNFSQLFEEVTKSSSELYDAFEQVKLFQTAELLGEIDSAKLALENARSSDLSEAEKEAQLERAWEKFENAYDALSHIPHLLQLKASVAEHIAVCFVLMGK